ncbi:hypothetical protein CLAIMM_10596 [Cladophialophora immunda]|nr:hypothetical protein CLAIMM_10596 [Cladophialophora immunda]
MVLRQESLLAAGCCVERNGDHAGLVNPISEPIADAEQTGRHESSTDLPITDVERQKVSSVDEKTTRSDTIAAQHSQTDTLESRRSALRTTLLMLALCISVLLAALDITIITTPLPSISSHFHSSTGYVWIGSAFLLGSGASGPTWGKLSDIFGRRPLLLSAAAVFLLGSALCGASQSMAMLIAGRAIQGIGAGGLLTLVNIVIGDLFSQRERGVYYGIIGMVWATAAAIGPVIGGALTEEASWRWCFYINLPTSGLAFFIILFTLRLHNERPPLIPGLRAIDWLGSLSITGGTTIFLLGLQMGGVMHPWNSATVICLIVFGVIAFILFLGIEWRVALYPIIPMHLLGGVRQLALLSLVFSHGAVFMQTCYFLPLYFQAVLGARPLLSGVWLLPYALSLSLSSTATGIYIKTTGRYFDCIVFGATLSVLGQGLLYDLPASRAWAMVIIYQIVAGIGAGPNFQAPLIALQSLVPRQDNATATATFGFTRNLACAIGVVIGSAAFANKMSSQQPALQAALGGPFAAQFSGARASANVLLLASLPDSQRRVVRRAFYESLKPIWIEVVCLAAAGLVAVLFIERRKKLDKTHEQVRTGLEAEEERRKIAQGLRTEVKEG